MPWLTVERYSQPGSVAEEWQRSWWLQDVVAEMPGCLLTSGSQSNCNMLTATPGCTTTPRLQLKKLSHREAKPFSHSKEQLALAHSSGHLASFVPIASLVFCVHFLLPPAYLSFGRSILDPQLLESVTKTHPTTECCSNAFWTGDQPHRPQHRSTPGLEMPDGDKAEGRSAEEAHAGRRSPTAMLPACDGVKKHRRERTSEPLLRIDANWRGFSFLSCSLTLAPPHSSWHRFKSMSQSL